jgi:hypothetical protein
MNFDDIMSVQPRCNGLPEARIRVRTPCLQDNILLSRSSLSCPTARPVRSPQAVEAQSEEMVRAARESEPHAMICFNLIAPVEHSLLFSLFSLNHCCAFLFVGCLQKHTTFVSSSYGMPNTLGHVHIGAGSEPHLFSAFHSDDQRA